MSKVWYLFSNPDRSCYQNQSSRISLVVQWLRICLPVQGTQVWSLVCEDPTCHRATKPESHSHWSPCSGACALQGEKPPQWGGHTPQLENSPHSWRPEQCSKEGPVQPKISPWVNKSIKRRAGTPGLPVPRLICLRRLLGGLFSQSFPLHSRQRLSNLFQKKLLFSSLSEQERGPAPSDLQIPC